MSRHFATPEHPRRSLLDALDEGAPAGTLAYLEKLAEVLEDGHVTADEAVDLAAIAEAEELASADITAANQAFALALAYAALVDGKVTPRGESRVACGFRASRRQPQGHPIPTGSR